MFFYIIKLLLLKKMKNKINLGIIGKNFGMQVVYKAFLKNKNLKFGFFK